MSRLALNETSKLLLNLTSNNFTSKSTVAKQLYATIAAGATKRCDVC